jgi:glucan 1,3-beta-glucosidase
MNPELFEGSGAEDEVWLNRNVDRKILADKMKRHRESFFVEKDVAYLAKQGVNLMRIPVPFFIFGDREPFLGCREYLDQAFDWAEHYGIQILIDLHTVPGSQNGYDNGGITGVCKWHKNPEEVEFALTVLERLAICYGDRKGLFGIEVLNEPISLPVYLTAPSRGKAKNKEEAKGSGYVPGAFLDAFYRQAYDRLRAILPMEKVIVFHDGFRLLRWGNYFKKEKMENVMLDTHIYVFAMESFVPIHRPWVYRMYIAIERTKIRKVSGHIPVIVGEWCICNRYAEKPVKGLTPDEQNEERKKRYRENAKIQQKAWEESAGYIYWSYQFRRDHREVLDEAWKESWDFSRCIDYGWMSYGIEGGSR